MVDSLMSVRVNQTPCTSGYSTSTASTSTTGATMAYAYQCRSRDRRTSAHRVVGDDLVLVRLGHLVQRGLGVLLAGQHVGVVDLQLVEQLRAGRHPRPRVGLLDRRRERRDGRLRLDVRAVVGRL